MARYSLKVTADVRPKLYRLRWHLAESSDSVGQTDICCVSNMLGFIVIPAGMQELLALSCSVRWIEYWVKMKLDVTSLNIYDSAKHALRT